MKDELKKYYLPLLLESENFDAAYTAAWNDNTVSDTIATYFKSEYGANGAISPREAFKAMYIEFLQPYTLNLTLHKKAFEVMVTGEKKEEFRTPSHWLMSRLWNDNNGPRLYKLVKFVNGYGAHRPAFISEFVGLACCLEKYGYCFSKTWSNGLKVRKINTDDLYIIELGEVIQKINLHK